MKHKEVKSKDKYFIIINESGNTIIIMGIIYILTYVCTYIHCSVGGLLLANVEQGAHITRYML